MRLSYYLQAGADLSSDEEGASSSNPTIANAGSDKRVIEELRHSNDILKERVDMLERRLVESDANFAVGKCF